MTEKFDVTILGTGLFGAALAYHLAQGTRRRVLALDTARGPRQPSATATSAGILSVQGWDPWDLVLVRESVAEYARLAEEEGVEPVRPNGGLRVARSAEGARWLARVHRVLEQEGEEVRTVGPREARELLPFADMDDVQAALYTPLDAVTEPSALQSAYLRAADRAGAVHRREETPPEVERLPGGGWKVGGERGGISETLVVAAGAWSKSVLTDLGHRLPLAPFRAQVLRVRPHPLLPVFPSLHDLDLNVYVRPADHGRLLIGDGTGTREEDPSRWAPEADRPWVEQTVATLRTVIRGLPDAPVEAAWAGLCVASPDRFPVVGRVPGEAHLIVASGFNGLGSMRAAGLARRLADALGSGAWDPLRPADPARFAAAWRSFEPRPQFPLEGESDGPAREVAGTFRDLPPEARASHEIRYRLLAGAEEADGLRWTSLSDWFDPFLGQFAKDALRTGGTVEVAEEAGRVRGLLLAGSSEGVGSGFTRTRVIAERYLSRMDPGGLYLDAAWRPGGEPVEIFAADLRDWRSEERLRNPVRLAGPEDLPRVRALMHEELGPSVDRWFATLPRPEENAFLCEVGGRVVGVSWITRVGPFARGHSFSVHPRYRGLGIGSDLLTARMLWLRRTGGRQVVSEIYDGNLASRTAAERAGMSLVDRMYHFRPITGP